MSVSIALLPVALAMRIVMGKENFENWIESQQVRIESEFKNEYDLVRALKKSGLDAIKFGSSIKTHFNHDTDFFFWERDGRKWNAIFSKGLEASMRRKILRKIEKAVGAQMFFDVDGNRLDQVVCYPTNFRDRDLLFEVLRDFGIEPKELADGSIRCKLQKSRLKFTQLGGEPFHVEITNSPDLQDLYDYLSELDDDYKKCIQTAAYEKIKARAAARNLTVESEEILADKTVLLTLNIN